MQLKRPQLNLHLLNLLAQRAQAICPSPPLEGLFQKGFSRFTLEAQMTAPVPLEVSMMSREVLTRTPLKQRIIEARGDNFTMDRVYFQVPQLCTGSHLDVLSYPAFACAVLQRIPNTRLPRSASRWANCWWIYC